MKSVPSSKVLLFLALAKLLPKMALEDLAKYENVKMNQLFN